MRQGIGGLSRDRPVVLVCQSGTRSVRRRVLLLRLRCRWSRLTCLPCCVVSQAFAAVALADLGYPIANYDGGMAEWLADPSREVETGDGRA